MAFMIDDDKESELIYNIDKLEFDREVIATRKQAISYIARVLVQKIMGFLLYMIGAVS